MANDLNLEELLRVPEPEVGVTNMLNALEQQPNYDILTAFSGAEKEAQMDSFALRMSNTYPALKLLIDQIQKMKNPLEVVNEGANTLKGLATAIRMAYGLDGISRKLRGEPAPSNELAGITQLYKGLVELQREGSRKIAEFYTAFVTEAKNLASERGLDAIQAVKDNAFREEVMYGRVFKTVDGAKAYYQMTQEFQKKALELLEAIPLNNRPNLGAMRLFGAEMNKYFEQRV